MIRFNLLILFPIALIFFLRTTTCNSQNITADHNPFHLALTQTSEAYRQQVAENPGMLMVDLVKKIKGVVLDIRYATANNFTHEVIYAAPRAFLRKPVADALQKVQDSLLHYHLGLKIYDAYRPYAASLLFYKVYHDSNFVANPRKGSRHNRGCAVDITLVERKTGKEIPMPSAFDEFSAKANPGYANLPDTVLTNRKFLFNMMAHFGFKPISTEWWHFDFIGWESYPLMDLSFEELDKAMK
ncbi:MAG: M15 family metallopeptidase [Bacteroidia bacterium]|nr:M15 family metallopeptidase [Bacteroidia bacterium]